MGAIFDAIAANPSQRHAIVRDAYLALPAGDRSISRDGYTITSVGKPTMGMNGMLQLVCRITRQSDGANVTPRGLNPIVIHSPPYLVPGNGDVTIDGVRYREDLGAALLTIIESLIDQVA